MNFIFSAFFFQTVVDTLMMNSFLTSFFQIVINILMTNNFSTLQVAFFVIVSDVQISFLSFQQLFSDLELVFCEDKNKFIVHSLHDDMSFLI